MPVIFIFAECLNSSAIWRRRHNIRPEVASLHPIFMNESETLCSIGKHNHKIKCSTENSCYLMRAIIKFNLCNIQAPNGVPAWRVFVHTTYVCAWWLGHWDGKQISFGKKRKQQEILETHIHVCTHTQIYTHWLVPPFLHPHLSHPSDYLRELPKVPLTGLIVNANCYLLAQMQMIGWPKWNFMRTELPLSHKLKKWNKGKREMRREEKSLMAAL